MMSVSPVNIRQREDHCSVHDRRTMRWRGPPLFFYLHDHSISFAGSSARERGVGEQCDHRPGPSLMEINGIFLFTAVHNTAAGSARVCGRNDCRSRYGGQAAGGVCRFRRGGMGMGGWGGHKAGGVYRFRRCGGHKAGGGISDQTRGG